MASTYPQAQEQKSFGSFLQKRTASFLTHQGAEEMTRSKQAAIAAWQAFNTRDPERIRAVLTEGAKWIAPPYNATQIMLGLDPDFTASREGIVAFLTRHFRRGFPDGARFEFTKVIAEDDTVMFEQRMSGVACNGKSYDNRYCWVFEMDGDRIREMREYMDTYAGHRQIFGEEEPRMLPEPFDETATV
jgi:ketosteroid isomerase-like protein